MRLDIVLPTFNRRELLKRTIDSVLSASVPLGLEVCLFVVDNNCSDGTAELVHDFERANPEHVRYVSESIPGRSSAINAGVLASKGEIVAFLDDDEEVFKGWITALEIAFRDPKLSFIGGPVIPRYVGSLPSWLPLGYPAIIGEVKGPDKVVPYGPNFEGMLMGGNAAIRRTTLEAVGPLNPRLGRAGGKRLMSGEDRDFYERLLASGASGQWVPDFKILHFLPPDRLTKRYHRRWAFDHGVSMAILEGESGKRLAIPRWRYGTLARESFRLMNIRAPEGTRFTSELLFLETVGYLLQRVGI